MDRIYKMRRLFRNLPSLGVFVLLLIGVFLGVGGCRERTGTALKIVCAPTELSPGQSAILSILEISCCKSNNRVLLKTAMIGERAFVSPIMQTTGKTSDGESWYRLQVFAIRPMSDAQVLTLGPEDFSNLPRHAFVPRMTINAVSRVEATKSDTLPPRTEP